MFPHGASYNGTHSTFGVPEYSLAMSPAEYSTGTLRVADTEFGSSAGFVGAFSGVASDRAVFAGSLRTRVLTASSMSFLRSAILISISRNKYYS